MLAQLVLATPRPLIGIYPTVGHSPGAYDEYQSWLSAAGADSRVLPTTFTGAKLEPLFQSLNGFLIPGGGDPFGESVDAMVRRAVRANEGGDYFPVWGTCLGFEWLTDIFGGSRSTIDETPVARGSSEAASYGLTTKAVKAVSTSTSSASTRPSSPAAASPSASSDEASSAVVSSSASGGGEGASLEEPLPASPLPSSDARRM